MKRSIAKYVAIVEKLVSFNLGRDLQHFPHSGESHPSMR
jgi:hypothetical protein